MDSDYYLSGLFDQITIQALTAGPVIALSLACLLLLVSGFVSASEVAFFSLTPGEINDIREENSPSDPLIRKLLDKVFVPFFTTKQGGSGIGLSVCRQILNRHGGNITVTSEMEKGTTFTMQFPGTRSI